MNNQHELLMSKQILAVRAMRRTPAVRFGVGYRLTLALSPDGCASSSELESFAKEGFHVKWPQGLRENSRVWALHS